MKRISLSLSLFLFRSLTEKEWINPRDQAFKGVDFPGSFPFSQVEVKRAIPRGEQHQNHHHHHHHHQFSDHQQHHGKPSGKSSGGRAGGGGGGDSGQAKTKKIFVGGLSANVTQEEFRGYFEKFGKITDVVVMYDSATHRPRGFGFITFESEESADGAVETTFQTLNGKTVEVKKAIPRDGGGGGAAGGDGGGGGKNGFYFGRSAQSPRTAGNGRGAILDSYGSGGIYPPYSHRLGGSFQGYGGAATPPYSPYGYGAAAAGEGYGFGGYGVGYGAPPYAGPRGAWNGAGYLVGGRRSPLPYAAAGGFFPGYFPGGAGGPYVGVGGGYHGFPTSGNGKWTPADGGGDHQVNGAAHDENGKSEDR